MDVVTFSFLFPNSMYQLKVVLKEPEQPLKKINLQFMLLINT